MRLSAATRKRLYREGKQLLGADRMARLRTRALGVARRGRTLEGRALRLGERLRPAPRAHARLVLQLDETHVLVAGRIDTGPEAAGAGARLQLVDGDGREHDVSDALHRYTDRRAARSGATASGFVVLHRLGSGGRARTMTLRLTDGREHTSTLPAPERVPDAQGRVVRLLGLIADCAGGRRALLDAVLGPAIERAWNTRERFARLGPDAASEGSGPLATRVDYNPGLAPASPRVSLIVPLYGRHDFLAHQLVHFVSDPELRAAEILYVVDDPRLESAVRRDADALARLHDIAFSIAYLPRNLGYAGANNAAAALARGDFLLLLNSDVLPAAPGWLGQMLAVADAAADEGGECLVGARLLYDDDSVQHDGMRFEAAPNFEGLWINRHPGKGLPRDLFPTPAEAPTREAVTGACLLTRRDRYAALGGLDEGYVLGDFEDSDFCLKARRAGLGIRLAARAELYHLERQSQSLVTTARWKGDLTHYNCWRHSRLWHDDIVALQAGGSGKS